jgi:hypothetical protein
MKKRLSLCFGSDVPEQSARRIQYVFAVFCKYYGIAQCELDADAIRVVYRGESNRPADKCFPALYQPRPISQPVAVPIQFPLSTGHGLRSQAPQTIPIFHGICPRQGRPDWLAEAFEWLSQAHELASEETDSVGRVPYHKTLCGEFSLSPEIPYVNVIFDQLLRDIGSVAGESWEREVREEMTRRPFTIAATHDVDFLPISFGSVACRFAKNLAIAILVKRSVHLSWQITTQALRGFFGGKTLGNCFYHLLQKEQQSGIRSTWNFLVARDHRRDGNYLIDTSVCRKFIQQLQKAGCEVALHSSYTCLEHPGQSGRELERLREITGFPIVGNRYHWLRHRGISLFRELQNAGCLYDTTVGFSDRPGFRSGAAFAYQPYDFDKELAFDILELPMIIMDTSLSTPALRESARRVYEAARTWGSGGVSILWHDTCFSRMQIIHDVDDLYWSLHQANDHWVAAAEILKGINKEVSL